VARAAAAMAALAGGPPKRPVTVPATEEAATEAATNSTPAPAANGEAAPVTSTKDSESVVAPVVANAADTAGGALASAGTTEDEKAAGAVGERVEQPSKPEQTSEQPAGEKESDGWDAARVRGFQRPEKIDILSLPRSLIGRIIGKAGATIKDIRERSGARIDARDQTEDPVQVLISGTTEAVDMAKSMLLDVAEGAAAASGDSSLAKLNALNAASAPSAATAPSAVSMTAASPGIQSGGSSGSRGPRSAAAAAAAAAAARVSERLAAAGGSTAVSQGASVAAAAGADAAAKLLAISDGDRSGSPQIGSIEEHVDLPKHATGKVIGTKGQQIAELRQKSGAQVDIDKSVATSCRVRIVGTREQIDKVKMLIQIVLETPAEGLSGEFMEIPKTAVGRVIGAGGARIQELQEKSGAKIDIDRSVEPHLCRFAGSAEAVALAKTLVTEVLEGKDRSSLGDAAITIEVSPLCTGRLIGPGGKQINEIQAASGAKVDIDKARDPCIVRMTGPTDAVAKAHAMVQEVIKNMMPVPAPPRPNPLAALLGQVSGANSVALAAAAAQAVRPAGGGSTGSTAVTSGLDEETIRFELPKAVAEKVGGNITWVRMVEQRTGARITVQRDGDVMFLEMSGQPEQIVEAEQCAEEAVRCMSMLAAGGPGAIQPPPPPAALPSPMGVREGVLPAGLVSPGLPPGSAPGASTLRRPPSSLGPGPEPIAPSTAPAVASQSTPALTDAPAPNGEAGSAEPMPIGAQAKAAPLQLPAQIADASPPAPVPPPWASGPGRPAMPARPSMAVAAMAVDFSATARPSMAVMAPDILPARPSMVAGVGVDMGVTNVAFGAFAPGTYGPGFAAPTTAPPRGPPIQGVTAAAPAPLAPWRLPGGPPPPAPSTLPPAPQTLPLAPQTLPVALVTASPAVLGIAPAPPWAVSTAAPPPPPPPLEASTTVPVQP